MTRRLIETAEAALREATRPPDVLEAAGRLIAMGETERIGSLDVEIDLDIGALDEDAAHVVETLGRADPPADTFLRVQQLLGPRDAVELRRIAAAHLLGREPELDLDEEASLCAFDEALRPALWRLTALNDWRAAQVQWIVPELRPRFWWWSEATDVSPEGATAIDAVAVLVARFPEAEQHLEKLAATQLLLATDDPAEVVDLRSWIEGRAGTGTLAMAASTGPREQILLEHPSFTLSFLRPRALLVDLLEPRGEALPRLSIGDRTIEGLPVPDGLERYSFDIYDIPADATEAELEITLASSRITVTLPTHGDAR